jgi:hypothetical protein
MRVARSVAEDGEVEPAEALRVGDHVDFDRARW